LVNTGRLFGECTLGKDEDPETRITNLENLRLKLQVMGLFMTDDQFMVQVLNSLKNDYELQMIFLEKRIGSKENPLTIDELKGELSLRYERLLMMCKYIEDSYCVLSVW
jgi:hypothetical protein